MKSWVDGCARAATPVHLLGSTDTSCDFHGACDVSAVVDDGHDYVANGNVAAISDGRSGNRGHRSMTYDALDRLTAVTVPQGPSSFFGNATYNYDVLDNLTRVHVTGGNNPRDHYYYCYNGNGQLSFVRTGPVCQGTASPAVAVLEYDPQGNVDLRNAEDYNFDLGNRLRRVAGKEWYAYDGHGRRVLSCTSAACDYQQYGFDGKLYLHRDNRANKLFDNIYLGGSLVAIREQPAGGGAVAVRYQHTDALGSPVLVTDQNRAVVQAQTSEYEPYGWPANRAWRDGPGYTGHVEDAATRLTYMQQRYYDPQIGRFLSVDPIGADPKTGTNFNRYKYAANNPYRVIDPDGRADLVLFGASDPLYAAGKAFDIPGMFTLAGHANSQFIQGANREQLTPDQTIALARSAGLKEGHTFFVGACNVGADGGAYAQALANKNNSLVLAATGFAMFPTTKDPDPTDNRGPYKPGNPVTLTVNSQRDGKGTPGSFAVFAPGGNGPMASGIRSATFNPETGKAQLRLAPETGTRIGRTVTVCADKDKCG